LERLPLSMAVSAAVAEQNDWRLPLSAGDDYELCFTVPKSKQLELLEALQHFSCASTCIGVIEQTPGLRCKLPTGAELALEHTGYQHFR